MKDWTTVLKAADAAARWHVHQRRKGAAKEPYINHLLEVATLVAEVTGGKDPKLVIAAPLIAASAIRYRLLDALLAEALAPAEDREMEAAE